MPTPGVSREQLSSFCKDMGETGFGPTLTASFYLSYLFKGPVPKYSHILGLEC